MNLTEQQIFILLDLVQDKIFMEKNINEVENLDPDFYLNQLGYIETELFSYQTENFPFQDID